MNTLNPGQPATVSVSFDGSDVHFSFGIPRGADGEVSTAQLTTAIASTATDPSGISPYAGSFSDPPTQAEMQSFAAYVEDLRSELER